MYAHVYINNPYWPILVGDIVHNIKMYLEYEHY